MSHVPFTNSKAAGLVCVALAAAVVSSLVFKHGLVPGLRMSFAVASVLIVFRASISISMGFLLRGALLGRLDGILLSVPLAYAAVALSQGWPGLALLGIIGVVGGMFVGVVCALASPHHRWR